jgi:hypothetical protein
MKDSNLTRLEKFRQLKKEIRGSEEHLVVGTDVVKKRSTAPILALPPANRFCENWSLTTA